MSSVEWNKHRFLIVDGDREFLGWAEQVLRRAGAREIACAPSGKDALARQKGFGAGIVLVELQLPDMHPAELMRAFQKLAADEKARPLVVPTASTATPETLRQACVVGIHSFVRKPTTEENFLKRVAAAIHNPRPFIFGRRYFGPERRRAQVAFDKPERRRIPARQVAPPRKAPVAPSDKAPAAAAKPVPAAKPAPLAKPAAAEKTPAAATEDLTVDLIDDEAAVASLEDVPPGIREVADDHLAWLRSAGKKGKRATLKGEDLQGADLGGINLSNADLRGANLSDANLRESVFQGADLRQADLSGADMFGGDFAVARLRHGVLRNTRLDGTSLRGTDLAGADLRGASLSGTDFTGASLLSTDIRETDLSGAKGLAQAQINQATADATTRLPGGLRIPATES